MPLDKFEIQLRNEQQQSYLPGQTIAGWVVIEVSVKPKKVHWITIELSGKAETHWVQRREEISNYYKDKEFYMKEKIYLLCFNFGDETSRITLEVGQTRLEFSFTLPTSLPSSFSHQHGNVQYQLEATIMRRRLNNFLYRRPFTSKLPFSLNGILDLNGESGVREANRVFMNGKVISKNSFVGMAGFYFTVSKTEFVPGERIGFYCELDNQSQLTVPRVVISLQKVVTFSGKHYLTNRCVKKTEAVRLSHIEGPALLAKERKVWFVTSSDSTLVVPMVPPSILGGCKLIDVSYRLEVKMERMLDFTIKGCLPIVIGTVPLREELPQTTSPEVPQTSYEVIYVLLPCPQAAPSRLATPFPPIPVPVPIPELPSPVQTSIESHHFLEDLPDLPPPTYEETINGIMSDDADSNYSDPPDYSTLDC